MTDTDKQTPSPLDVFKDTDELCLLFVSVGPVQDFIAEARKARDLWAGSYLLSRATYEAMRSVIEKHTAGAILLPHIEASAFYRLDQSISVNPEELMYANTPNYFIALIPKESLYEITTDMKGNLSNYWCDVSKKVRCLINNSVTSISGWDSLWDFQIADLFHIYWVALPVAKGEINSRYKELYSTIQHAMQERKLTRTFKQNKGARVIKCVQCGHRETAGPEDRSKFKDFWEKIADNQRLSFRVKSGEKLCAVCLVKRLASEKDIFNALKNKVTFDSTSDIASQPFRASLKNNMTDELVLDLKHSMSELSQVVGNSAISSALDIPGNWCYEEGVRVSALKKQYPNADTAKLEKSAFIALECLKKVYGKFGKPDKYYAIIMLDGDKMGKYLSGDKMPSAETFSIDWQRRQSEILSEIGTKTFPDIVKPYNGAIIYAGGDDLLAFGPLDWAIDTVDKLRTAFASKFHCQIHCSAGLVIVHHQGSLRAAMNECRGALQRAKECYGRNAIAISIMLSSGTNVRGGWKWDLGNGKTFAGFLQSLVEWFSKESNGLSVSFVHDLMMELPAFYDKNGELQEDMLRPEIQRLLNRHLPDKALMAYKGWEVINDHVVDTITMLCSSQRYSSMGIRGVEPMTNIESVLRIATFIGRQDK